MLYGSVRVLCLALLLAGLCAPAQANTTSIADAGRLLPVAQSANPAADGVKIAQNDLAMPRYGKPDADPAATAPQRLPPPPPITPVKKVVRIALLLPLHSDNLRLAATVVRAGIWAAHGREKDESIVLATLETGDAPQDVLSGYVAAVRDHDIVIGPLSRSGVTAIAQSGQIGKPTIALTQTDNTGDTEAALPPGLLVMGLSIEDEARQMANWIAARKEGKSAMVVYTSTAWQRRAAKAFSTQWQQLGAALHAIEIGVTSGFLNANSLVQLRKRIQADRPDLVFVALDAGQAAQVRETIGQEIALYGTSQLNPRALPDWGVAERMPEMNGVRLLDLPWQLQADHPAVMAYPRLVEPEQKYSADLERLYALGIDAYRVAREIAANNSAFEIDGVTGKLAIRFGRGPSRFERVVSPAIYQDGMVVPLER
jgi:outer membrane PBP1 activator LpoA protein